MHAPAVPPHHRTTAPHTSKANAWFIEFNSGICYVQHLARCVTTFSGRLSRWPRGKPDSSNRIARNLADSVWRLQWRIYVLDLIWTDFSQGQSFNTFSNSSFVVCFFFFLIHLFWTNFRFAWFSHAFAIFQWLSSLISLIKADRAIIKLSAARVAPSHKRQYQKLWQQRKELKNSCFNNNVDCLGGIFMLYDFKRAFWMMHAVWRALREFIWERFYDLKNSWLKLGIDLGYIGSLNFWFMFNHNIWCIYKLFLYITFW